MRWAFRRSRHSALLGLVDRCAARPAGRPSCAFMRSVSRIAWPVGVVRLRLSCVCSPHCQLRWSRCTNRPPEHFARSRRREGSVLHNWVQVPDAIVPPPAVPPLRVVFVGGVVTQGRAATRSRRCAYSTGARCTLRLIGGSAEDGDRGLRCLQEQASDLVDGGRVTFVGELDPAACAPNCALRTSFTLPSDAEGMPLAMLEALAEGRPVLVTDAGQHGAGGSGNANAAGFCLIARRNDRCRPTRAGGRRSSARSRRRPHVDSGRASDLVGRAHAGDRGHSGNGPTLMKKGSAIARFARRSGVERRSASSLPPLAVASGFRRKRAVLEVGAGRNSREWGWPAQVTAADLSAHRGLSVQADAARLPFRDGAFAATACVDVIEHIPGSHRSDVIAELARVTRDALVIGGPFGPGSRRTDERLHRRGQLGREQPRVAGRASIARRVSDSRTGREGSRSSCCRHRSGCLRDGDMLGSY